MFDPIESIYQTLPLPQELKRLKRLAYSNSSYSLASKAYANKNYKQAIDFCIKAFCYDPMQCFSRNFVYLLSKSILQFALGSQGYERFIGFISFLKSYKLFFNNF